MIYLTPLLICSVMLVMALQGRQRKSNSLWLAAMAVCHLLMIAASLLVMPALEPRWASFPVSVYCLAASTGSILIAAHHPPNRIRDHAPLLALSYGGAAAVLPVIYAVAHS